MSERNRKDGFLKLKNKYKKIWQMLPGSGAVKRSNETQYVGIAIY